jgi:hypothetical protein
MASAARQGIAISSATFAHISALNLPTQLWVSPAVTGISLRILTFRTNVPTCSFDLRPTHSDARDSFDSEDDS